MKQMKRIVVWASIQYVVHVDGATIHVAGADERQVEFGDGTTSFATLSGGEGYINSTVTVNAPDFVTMTGKSMNEMMTLIQEQQAAIVSQQADIEALKQFVGMVAPAFSLVQPGAQTLQSALSGTAATLVLENGVFTGSAEPDNSFYINRSVTIRAQNHGEAILDGQSASRRVLYIGSGVVVLEGLIIRNGRDVVGAGILISSDADSSTVVRLVNCTISDNYGHGYRMINGQHLSGAGGLTIIGTRTVVHLYDCEIKNNDGGHGGGVQIQGGQAAFTRCAFKGNRGGAGGGVFIKSPTGQANFTTCTFSDNIATNRWGGGLRMEGGTALFQDCNIVSNSAPYHYVGPAGNWDGKGGGAYIQGAQTSATFRNCNITDNTAYLQNGRDLWNCQTTNFGPSCSATIILECSTVGYISGPPWVAPLIDC